MRQKYDFYTRKNIEICIIFPKTKKHNLNLQKSLDQINF